MNKIDTIVSILNKDFPGYVTPSVTQVAAQNHPFKVLASTILSLRTKDEVTLPASKRLFLLADSPDSMLKLSLKKIEKAIYPVGFYKTKARTLHHISEVLIQKYKGKVPSTMEQLLEIKGIGRKTANLVLTEAFNKPGLCVDTHVHRISNRLGLVDTKNAHETEFALRELLPMKHWKPFNMLLVTHGQNICRPISPKCSQCHIYDYCQRRQVNYSR